MAAAVLSGEWRAAIPESDYGYGWRTCSAHMFTKMEGKKKGCDRQAVIIKKHTAARGLCRKHLVLLAEITEPNH